MISILPLYEALPAQSFLEYAFLRWVVTPAARSEIIDHMVSQQSVVVGEHHYRVDYDFVGLVQRVSVELDGFAYHSDRTAFNYDRMRHNDLLTTGRKVLHFTYEAIRLDTERCVVQLQAALRQDEVLAAFVLDQPTIERPDMNPDPLYALAPVRKGREHQAVTSSYFDGVRDRIN